MVGLDNVDPLDFVMQLAQKSRARGENKCWANRQEINLLVQRGARIVSDGAAGNGITYLLEVEYRGYLFIHASFKPIVLSLIGKC